MFDHSSQHLTRSKKSQWGFKKLDLFVVLKINQYFKAYSSGIKETKRIDDFLNVSVRSQPLVGPCFGPPGSVHVMHADLVKERLDGHVHLHEVTNAVPAHSFTLLPDEKQTIVTKLNIETI